MGGSTAKLPPLPTTPVAVPPLGRHRRTDYPGASDIWATHHTPTTLPLPLPHRTIVGAIGALPDIDYWWALSRRDTCIDANMGVCGILPGIKRAGTSKRATWIHPNHPEGIAYMTLSGACVLAYAWQILRIPRFPWICWLGTRRRRWYLIWANR